MEPPIITNLVSDNQLKLPSDATASALLHRALFGEPFAIIPVLHRPSFVPRGPNRPPWLCWALMAVGSLFAPEVNSEGPAPVGGWGLRLYKYATAAMSESILGQMPTIHNLQTLLYLGLFAAVDPVLAARDVPGLLKTAVGMMRYLSVDVEDDDKHENRTSSSTAGGPSSAAELRVPAWLAKEERRRVYWALVSADHFASTASGTPSLLLEAAARDNGRPEATRSTTRRRLLRMSFSDWDSPAIVPQNREPALTPLPDADSPILSVAEMKTLGARLYLLEAWSSQIAELDSTGPSQFGPTADALAVNRRLVIALKHERWADAKELEPPHTNHILESKQARWYYWHCNLAFCWAPVPALLSILRGDAAAMPGAVARITEWLTDVASLENCKKHVKAIAGFLGALLAGGPQNAVVDAAGPGCSLSILGTEGNKIALCALAWLLIDGSVGRSTASSLLQTSVTAEVDLLTGGSAAANVLLSRTTAPPIADAAVFPTLVAVLRRMGQPWKACEMLADGLNEVVEAMKDLGLVSTLSRASDGQSC